MDMPEFDFAYVTMNGGWLLRPLSDAAKEFSKEKWGCEESTCGLYIGIRIEEHLLDGIIEGLRESGFSFLPGVP